MDVLSQFLDRLAAGGALALIALVVLSLEMAAFALFVRDAALRRSLVLNGASGVALMLALHAALTGGGGLRIALFLLLSFVAHLVDLAARLRAARAS